MHTTKILIVSRITWDDNRGTSTTLSNFFADYDASKIAQIYIETKPPRTKCCKRFFQISEISLVHKLLKWRIKTGREFNVDACAGSKEYDTLAQQEAKTFQFARQHRSMLLAWCRELLWMFGGWKSRELDEFVENFNPDVIWLEGSSLAMMYRLYLYVINIAKKPVVIFLQDDIYTYESCSKNMSDKLYKSYLRRWVKRTINKCEKVFVASPKMKSEYDKIFRIDSIFIAKSINPQTLCHKDPIFHNPIRMVYMGQVIYGRIYTLIDIANVLKDINKNSTKVQLSIYTNNILAEKDRNKLLESGCVSLEQPVPYEQVSEVISKNDVVVFVESLDPNYCNIARLSFSTKICDYLTSGKCIFAVGPSDSAPIEYFIDEKVAIVSTSKDGIRHDLNKLFNEQIVNHLISNAEQCVLKNHNRVITNNTIYSTLKRIRNT